MPPWPGSWSIAVSPGMRYYGIMRGQWLLETIVMVVMVVIIESCYDDQMEPIVLALAWLRSDLACTTC